MKVLQFLTAINEVFTLLIREPLSTRKHVMKESSLLLEQIVFISGEELAS
jgi:hypothetical protein